MAVRNLRARGIASHRRTILLVPVIAILGMHAGVHDATRGLEADPRNENATPSYWRPGNPVPIRVTEGKASLVIPTPTPGSRTMLVVSALARSGGPFPITVKATATKARALRPPEIEASTVRRTPELALCPLPAVPPPARTTPPTVRAFHLMVRDGDVISPSNYLTIHSSLRSTGERVQIYVDDDDAASVGPDVLRDIVTTFDRQVFPVSARTLGQARDIDGDGRFTVLMSSWLNRLGNGRHAVDGFVRAADIDLEIPSPFSNHCDMMYVSSTLAPGPHLRTILAHEYAHAVTSSARRVGLDPESSRLSPPLDEEGWLDEAIAHLVEDLHGFSRSNLDYRVSAFLSQPERYRLVVDDYYAADLFRSHGNRGGTYLFLRWCADRYGPELLPALVRSGRRGVVNLEAATGRSFAELFRDWSVALYSAGLEADPATKLGFRSVDLKSPFDDWELAGPRPVTVMADGPELTWNSAATASRYLLIEPSATGAVEVTIEAPAFAGLQVTALRLPDDLPELKLSAREASLADGTPALGFTVEERNGGALRLTSLSWEPLVPAPNPHMPTFRRAGLDQLGVAAAFGRSTIPAKGRMESRPVSPAGALPVTDVPLVVKAVATDARGRRVAAWAEISPEESAMARARNPVR